MNKKGMKSERVGDEKKRRPRFIQKCDREERFWGLTRLRAWKFPPKVRSSSRKCLKKQTPINFRAFFNEKKSLELGQADNASRKKNPATDFAIVINVINSNVYRGWAVCLSSLLRENWDFWRSRVIKIHKLCDDITSHVTIKDWFACLFYDGISLPLSRDKFVADCRDVREKRRRDE